MKRLALILGSLSVAACGQPLLSSPPIVARTVEEQVNPVQVQGDGALFQRLADFGETNGAIPFAGLVDVGGTFYGTTTLGGNSGCFSYQTLAGCGVVYKVTPSGRQAAIYSFRGSPDGSFPFAGLTTVGGTLYGITTKGGNSSCGSSSSPSGCGTVFKITSSGSETVLHSFAGGNDGQDPPWAPLVAVKGVLFGVTQNGGTRGGGTLFKITTAGKESVLYSFKKNSAESHPEGIAYIDGEFFATTEGDGGPYSHDYGSLVKLTSSGKASILYTFKSFPDGAFPKGPIVSVGDVLYGATVAGGANQCGSVGCGTVFAITMSGKEHVIHSFNFKKHDGVTPYSGLMAKNGSLYGTACCGGPSNGGIVFKLTTSGKETILHAFTSYGKDGDAPYGGLVAAGGLLYGTTGYGGKTKGHFKYGYGTVFSVRP